MPVYLTHWRDGDCSLTAANNREEAAAHFQHVACVEPDTIYEMQAPDLTVTLALTEFGKLSVEDFTPVLKEMREVCYPELVETLGAGVVLGARGPEAPRGGPARGAGPPATPPAIEALAAIDQ